MSTILITGSASGLGRQLRNGLRYEHEVIPYDYEEGDDVRHPDRRRIEEYCGGKLDVLINCAGINKIDWIENFDSHDWDHVMDVNAKGIFMMTKACLPMLKASQGTVLNIVSNASHMPMTCSTAYNASKGAAHIMTLQMARELTKKYSITVFGISPNKLRNTGMSHAIEQQVCITRGWTPQQAADYQKAALLTGEETDPHVLAEFITFLLGSKKRHKYLTGCIIPYGA